MGVHQYFKSLNDLEKLIRCPGKFKYQEHNVAAHSFKVTKIAQYLGTVEEYHGNEVNWKDLYEKALNHDYPEIFTGDIKTPVKYASGELNMLFMEVEETMTSRFIEEEFPEQCSNVNVVSSNPFFSVGGESGCSTGGSCGCQTAI